jgi:Spherulation-specific family 4
MEIPAEPNSTVKGESGNSLLVWNRAQASGRFLVEEAMIEVHRVCRLVLLSFLLPIALMLYMPASLRADTGIIVPSYFYPGTGGPGGAGDGWAAMDTAAAKVPLIALLNPNSGPITGPADPNYVAAMTHLESAGGKVAAYVFTNFGAASLASVESQINTYISQYGSLIDGFFLDGTEVLPSTLSYYQSLDHYIHGLSASYLVLSNPGQPFLNGVSPADYLSTADITNIFEGPDTAPPGDPQFTDYPYGQTWYQSFASGRFSNIIFDVPESSLLTDVDRAVALKAGYVFVTDQNLPNPYGQLPSYWDQEVSDVASAPAPVPEPATLLLLLTVLPVIRLGKAKHRSCTRI